MRPQGRSAGGMAGIRVAAGQRVRFFGALDPARDGVVVTVSGSADALPGTDPGAIKVTPFAEYPGKGRGTAGVRAHTRRPASLAGVLGEGGDLDRPGVGAGERVGRAAHGDDDPVAGRVERSEEADPLTGRDPDAGHPAGAAALRPHGGGVEVEQLGVGGDEDQLLLAGTQLCLLYTSPSPRD